LKNARIDHSMRAFSLFRLPGSGLAGIITNPPTPLT
jgi:hypothetical protein